MPYNRYILVHNYGDGNINELKCNAHAIFNQIIPNETYNTSQPTESNAFRRFCLASTCTTNIIIE